MIISKYFCGNLFGIICGRKKFALPVYKILGFMCGQVYTLLPPSFISHAIGPDEIDVYYGHLLYWLLVFNPVQTTRRLYLHLIITMQKVDCWICSLLSNNKIHFCRVRLVVAYWIHHKQNMFHILRILL